MTNEISERQMQVARMLAVQIYVSDVQYERAEKGLGHTGDYSWRRLEEDQKRYYIALAVSVLETLSAGRAPSPIDDSGIDEQSLRRNDQDKQV